MKRIAIGLSLALAGAVALQAQDVKTKTETKIDDGKSVVYTGCLQTGTEAKSYILENAIPMKETKTETTIGQSGLPETKTTTTTSYVLVPQGQIEFQQNVGHKVEVTAMMIPAGDDKTKIETKTETKVEGQPTQRVETKEKVAQKDWPQLRVISVRHLADRCTPQP